MKRHFLLAALAVLFTANSSSQSSFDQRALEAEQRLTDDERYSLIWGYMPMPSRLGPAPTPPGIKPSAGYFPPIASIDFPGLHETDAGLGVTNPKYLRENDYATALPSGLALAATFNPELAYESGAMVAREAKAKGFNVLLAGGVNLTRDWFGGRNFEYLGEDPLLAGLMAGYSVKGVQSERVVSTVKHFAINSQETLRHSLNAIISEEDLRESDLLAFELAIETGNPGAVMCSYNKINGDYGCGNDWLLNKVLRDDWGFKGWVMSDWGATHGPEDITAGLDQESGAQLDKQVWFDQPLRQAINNGDIDRQHLSQSVRRILRSVYAVGADAPRQESDIDFVTNGEVALKTAQESIVLLKNDGILPLAKDLEKILVVGRFSDRGVLSGGGSSQVIPYGGAVLRNPYGGSPFLLVNGFQVLHPSSPLEALQESLPNTVFEFDTGYVPELAAARAAQADAVIVFANKWQVESLDTGSLALPQGQDDLIATVAQGNSNIVVVLETGNPVDMPWLEKVRGVAQAWYSGQRGGEAIADVLTGTVNPSGHLPMTFPMNINQAPRSEITGLGLPDDGSYHLDLEYVEGASVGYRWYVENDIRPLFPFGFGLSYTEFEYGKPKVTKGADMTALVRVKNVGKVAGADVVQLYLVEPGDAPKQRLVGFAKVHLDAGESRAVTINIEPKLVADWTNEGWHIAKGKYQFAVGHSAQDLGKPVSVRLNSKNL